MGGTQWRRRPRGYVKIRWRLLVLDMNEEDAVCLVAEAQLMN